MLGELEALTLVVRFEIRTVEHARALRHPLVDEAAHDLAVLQHEGGFMAADFEDPAGA